MFNATPDAEYASKGGTLKTQYDMGKSVAKNAAKAVDSITGIFKPNKSAANEEKNRKRMEGQEIINMLQKGNKDAMKTYAQSKGMTVNALTTEIYAQGFNILTNPKFKEMATLGGLEEKGKVAFKNLNATGYGKDKPSNSAKGFDGDTFLKKTTGDILENAWSATGADGKSQIKDTLSDSMWLKVKTFFEENTAALVGVIVLIIGGVVYIIRSLFTTSFSGSGRKKGGV